MPERGIAMPANICLFCGHEVDNFHNQGNKIYYECTICGIVRLSEEAYTDFTGYVSIEKRIISIVLRNEFENSNHKPPVKYLTIDDLKKIIAQYTPLDPIAKMDNALINIAKASKYVGHVISFLSAIDYPYFHCLIDNELTSVLKFLYREGLIVCEYDTFSETGFYITAKGYQRLREIAKPRRDSKKCFVAIWFTPEMNEVYGKAIKPAIEFKENGESLPRFEAVKIDNMEHINDINLMMK